jgi:hypothetical protein
MTMYLPIGVGTTTFSVSRDDIINRALRLCGTYDATNTPGTADYVNISLAFNMMIKAWIRKGLPMWKVVTNTVPLLAGQNTYNIGPYATGTGAVVTSKILKVTYAFIRDNQNFDTPIDPLSIQEYNQFAAKSSLGVVNSYWYQPLDDNSITGVNSFISFYPTPNDSTRTIYLIGLSTLQDVNVGTDPVDFPQECYMALSWCLADEISMEYATSMDRVKEIQGRAMKLYEEMVDWSQENTDSIRFMYDTRSR